MSTGWSLFVIVVTLGMFAWFAIMVIQTLRTQDPDGHNKLNDHEFDGITEFDAPMPKWFSMGFLASIVFSIIYLLLYPGLGSFPGFLDWTSVKELEQDQSRAQARHEPIYESYLEISAEDLSEDRDAMLMAERLFGNYCSQCHGENARGNFGFPNLTDDHWQWGNSIDQIRASIHDGRNAAMPGWESALGNSGIRETTAYVLALADREHDADDARRGEEHFANYCASCHGAEGTGNPGMGAPDLTSGVYLYGGEPRQIAFTLRNGRNGVMPAQEDELSEAWIHLLTAYVYGLSKDASAAP